jgi:hypothetical protein
MPYGYLGQNTPNQTVSNSGVFSISDVASLEKQGKFGGSLELIAENSFSSVSALDLTEIKETKYDVHLLQLFDLQSAQDNGYWGIQFYESGVLETSGVYQYAKQYVYTGAGTAGEFLTTAGPNIQIGHAVGSNTNEKGNLYCYIYNAGNSSKYTFVTCHSTGLNGALQYATEFGGGVLPQASLVDGFRILETERAGSPYDNISGNYKLYGVKQL